jgi:SAM-dependent methyltransferase
MPGSPATALLSLVRCPQDGGELLLAGRGAAVCVLCGTSFGIRDGILDLLGVDEPDNGLSRVEMAARDNDARTEHPRGLPSWHPRWRNELEVPATMRRVGDVSGRTVLELGCGTGLYTRLLTERGARVLAVDFSLESLHVNRAHLPAGAVASFVRVDVSGFRLRPRSIDFALTTLYSNLPTPEHREAVNLAVREALTPGGRYVVSAHHQDIRRRFGRVDRKGLYSEQFPVFYECLTRADLRRELGVFASVDVEPIVIFLPWLSRIPFMRPTISRLTERIPLLRDFGQLLLATARASSESKSPLLPRG